METGAKLSNMLIAVLVLGLIITGFGFFMNGLNVAYSVDDSVIDNFTSVYTDAQNDTLYRMQSISGNITQVEEGDFLDRLSSFFRAGYDTAIIAMGSFDDFGRLTNAGIRQIPFLGDYGTIITYNVIGIILIIVIVRIFLHFLIKSDRI